MEMIHKINLMVVPIKFKDLLLTLTGKSRGREDASHVGIRVTSGTTIQI
jgi:hypothetical protein